ncbi:hypothetical protein [Denitrobaculum tricleocarpae]|uniref:DUF2946 domain-containing protein n=1 Tax=Denitrobaculum tricleocarpae TaxID=2591009 RepID=A0A545TKF5_9PROT|nr:hypothetical protein [Denitrobaculum tricleocarpae]TQV77695.1 hypothetical protein FKG95_19210 [Denitrobaculum tricleocarpae]
MKNLQPFLAALVIAMTALFFAILSMADVPAPGKALDAPASRSIQLALHDQEPFPDQEPAPDQKPAYDFRAADDLQVTLAASQDCPCPPEREEVECNLDLCSAGIIQNAVPANRTLAVTPNPILRDDLSGIAKEPEHSPPRLSA